MGMFEAQIKVLSERAASARRAAGRLGGTDAHLGYARTMERERDELAALDERNYPYVARALASGRWHEMHIARRGQGWEATLHGSAVEHRVEARDDTRLFPRAFDTAAEAMAALDEAARGVAGDTS